MNDLPPELIARCRAVTAKRPRTVIDHILTHGHITTEELKELYGYNHPPRAARDVREQGIPLETFRVTGSDGRKIGAYR
ncbi:MAG TPA: HNH endonuclease, partial [Anaerolineae bacterium]|nr:HNH endonuclease [Anaerolineae bacterium]